MLIGDIRDKSIEELQEILDDLKSQIHKSHVSQNGMFWELTSYRDEVEMLIKQKRRVTK